MGGHSLTPTAPDAADEAAKQDNGAIRFRHPTAEDGHAVWSLVGESPPLERNSCYAYLLLCRDFAATSLVAERDGALVGFVIGYRRPARPDTLFVWQVGVAESARGCGLGREMLLELLAPNAADGVGRLEASVAPSNEASRRLFASLARDVGAPCREETLFAPDLFPGGHEEEVLFRIGPFAPDRVREALTSAKLRKSRRENP